MNDGSGRKRVARTFGMWVGAMMLLALVAFSFLGPCLYSIGATQADPALQLMPPSWRFPLGTNVLGQNELARLMLGGQLPILAGFITMFVVMTIGGVIGVLAGSAGALDSILMRITDGVLGIPQVVLVLFIEAVHGSTPEVLIFAVAVTSWPSVARIVRAQVLVLRNMDYVHAAVAVGNSQGRIAIRHLVPNLLDTLLTLATAQFTNSVMLIAIATFIGLGVGSFDWASMLASDFNSLTSGQWWLVIPPGLLFSALIIAVYLVGESARRSMVSGGMTSGGGR